MITDFGAYPAWNPFILKITGEAKVGARLKVQMQALGVKAIGDLKRFTVMHR